MEENRMTGRVTIPTDLDVVPETLEILTKWGADAIRDCTRTGVAVLDGFCGSGTTIIAAQKTGRIGFGIEFDPLYIEVAIRRFEKLTGETARHAQSGMTLAELTQSRSLPENDNHEEDSHVA